MSNVFTKKRAVDFIREIRALAQVPGVTVKRRVSHCGQPSEYYRTVQVSISVDVPWIRAEDGEECYSLKQCAHFIFMISWRKSSNRWSVTCSSNHGHPGYGHDYRPGKWNAGYALGQVRTAIAQNAERRKQYLAGLAKLAAEGQVVCA